MVENPKLKISWLQDEGPFGAKLSARGFGLNFYPEADHKDPHKPKNKIFLKFELEKPRVKDTIVYFRLLDPCKYPNKNLSGDIFVKENDNYSEGFDELKTRYPKVAQKTCVNRSSTKNEVHCDGGVVHNRTIVKNVKISQTREVEYTLENSLVIPAGSTFYCLSLTLSDVYAGDNFIAIAGFDAQKVRDARLNNAPLKDNAHDYCWKLQKTFQNDVVQTELLTVWRTLWIECDQFCYEYTSQDNYLTLPTSDETSNLSSRDADVSGSMSISPSDETSNLSSRDADLRAETPLSHLRDGQIRIIACKPDITGHARDAFAAACIDLQEYPQTHTSQIYINGLRGVHSKLLNHEVKACLEARDSPIATEIFWTAHAIGAFREILEDPQKISTCAILGCVPEDERLPNVFFTYDSIIDPNSKAPEQLHRNFSQHVAAHEIGHLFGLPHTNVGLMSNMSNMQTSELKAEEFSAAEILAIQKKKKPN
ncbi:MAG: hypothetical protein IJ991_06115 [Thermoguttaceae bacterium]|nr:hypothetical protein [Thermoguttaceae bacterium]